MSHEGSLKPTLFPDKFATKEAKQKPSYGLQYAKAIWAEHLKREGSYNEQLELFKENRRYAEGLQSIDKYKNQLNLMTGDLSWLNLDFSPVTRIAALVNNMEGKIMNQLYTIQCTPIDIASKTQEDKDWNKLKAAMFLRRNAADLEPLTGVPVYPRDVKMPDSDDEAELFFKLNYKQASAIAMEQGLDFVFMNNDFDSNIRKKIIRDLIVNNRAALHRYYDENMNIRVAYKDHTKVITPYSVNEDFSNIPYIGEIDDITIGQVAEMTDEFDETALEEIAKKFQGQYDNPNMNDLASYEGYYNSSGGLVRPWENYNVKVLTFYFLSTCKENRVKTTKDNGRVYWDKASESYQPKSKNKELVSKNVQYLFEGKWIIGSDYIFNYKMASNIPRARENGAYSTKAELPIVMIAPNIFDMQNKSLVERARPHEDQLNLINLKIQQHLINAKPPGVAINTEALSDIVLGHGKEAATPQDIYKMYSQTGSIVYSDRRDNGEIINGRPIDYLPNGIGADFAVLVNAYREEMNKINDVIGYNSAVDASSPGQEAVVGVAKMAIQGTNNALRSLYYAHVRLIERASRGIAIMIQDSLKFNEEAFLRGIGAQATEVLKLGRKLATHQFGIKIEMAPDDEERADLIVLLQKGLDTGLLNSGDAFEIRQQMKTNVKLAGQMLVQRETKNRRLAEAQKKLEIDYNGKVQIESGKAAAQAQAEAEERIAMAKANLIQVEYDLKDRNDEKNHQRILEQIKLKNIGSVEVQTVKNEGQLESTAFQGIVDHTNQQPQARL